MDGFDLQAGGITSASSRRCCFTIARANRALVLVRRIVADVVTEHERLIELHEVIDEADGGDPYGRRARAESELAAVVVRLKRCLAELAEVGVELKHFSQGIADFPCRVNGRPAQLCWRLGEPAVAHWHGLGQECAERRPILTFIPADRSGAGSGSADQSRPFTRDFQ